MSKLLPHCIFNLLSAPVMHPNMLHVTFNPVVTIFDEPLELAQALHESRKNKLFQWRNDCVRIKVVLDPILTKSHREKVLQQRQQFVSQ